MNAEDSVRAFISKIDAGTVFSIRDINVNTGYDSIKTQISDACSKGLVDRIIRGIYYKPKYNKLLSRSVPYEMSDVANAIARMNGWRIIPSGNACMNIVGLSTQVPSKHLYLSDGPYKKYVISGTTLEFRHRASKNLPMSKYAATLTQAIKTKGVENIDVGSISTISGYMRKNKIDIDDFEHVSMWIKDVVKEAHDEPLRLGKSIERRSERRVHIRIK